MVGGEGVPISDEPSDDEEEQSAFDSADGAPVPPSPPDSEASSSDDEEEFICGYNYPAWVQWFSTGGGAAISLWSWAVYMAHRDRARRWSVQSWFQWLRNQNYTPQEWADWIFDAA